jgi:hypothetical protein
MRRSALKKILRSAVLVAGIATGLILGSTSANAAGAGVFTGDVSLNGFGVGSSTGEAWLCVVGAFAPPPTVATAVGPCTSVTGHAASNVHATFDLNEPSASCPATGTAVGSVTGAVTGNFTWTRVGAVAVISTSGGSLGTGVGVAAFAVTSPVGNPCNTAAGTTVKATVAGALVATGV